MNVTVVDTRPLKQVPRVLLRTVETRTPITPVSVTERELITDVDRRSVLYVTDVHSLQLSCGPYTTTSMATWRVRPTIPDPKVIPLNDIDGSRTPVSHTESNSRETSLRK